MNNFGLFSSFTQNVVDWTVEIMEALGPIGVAFLIALENLFPPLPSEVVLPLAGFTASQGNMNLLVAIIAATIGSLIGASMLYAVGAVLGRDRTIAIAKKLPLVKVSDIEKTEKWFLKHETKAVFWGRMLPIFRSLISIPAGVEKMPVKTFLALTTAGSLIWNTIFIVAGYTLGENWHQVEKYGDAFQKLIVLVLVLAGIYFVLSRTLLKKSRKKTIGS